MQFTEEQQQVIDSRRENLLVSAAAGSGKTAVLVERILQRILDEKEPVDIDRMLIVTFMRQQRRCGSESVWQSVRHWRHIPTVSTCSASPRWYTAHRL